MYLYLDGQYVEEKEAFISPLDHGYLYGLGLFETFRTYNGHPFLLDDHFHRLAHSAEKMGIVINNYRREDVTCIIEKLLKLNSLNDAYIRWNVAAGTGEIGLSTELYTTPRIIVYMKSLPQKTLKNKQAKTLTIRRNSPEADYRLKSHHYLNNVLGRREVGNGTDVEGIFLTEDGYLSEGVVSNLFWVKDGVVYTPDLTCGCLNGITRQFVMAVLKKKKIRVEEGKFRLQDALKADEVFVTNAIQEIIPIHIWEQCRFPGNNGGMVRLLQSDYAYWKMRLWSKNDLLLNP
ncbi:aminodeoxychorismate lyase [Salipaludibacillus sp. LMS25]|jgi:4-amino-4-deoxychorismate lyase|uniref:aminodeoxychorismate lyase n=1 Tax=Salipaludibacillus sp. LMS25 TaxID=2924031 RepID=UPI0020D01226|nr:aminodeoxychorismate lyase [Salipaludibacillus sp. LMS25]UTR16677.1 aminodeoxychorismate lyase [Salipaludibacillus sp. LMS25]